MSRQATAVISFIAILLILCFTAVGSLEFKMELTEWQNSPPDPDQNIFERAFENILRAVISIVDKIILVYLIFLLAFALLKLLNISACSKFISSVSISFDMLIIIISSLLFVFTFSVSGWIILVASVFAFIFDCLFFASES